VPGNPRKVGVVTEWFCSDPHIGKRHADVLADTSAASSTSRTSPRTYRAVATVVMVNLLRRRLLGPAVQPAIVQRTGWTPIDRRGQMVRPSSSPSSIHGRRRGSNTWGRLNNAAPEGCNRSGYQSTAMSIGAIGARGLRQEVAPSGAGLSAFPGRARGASILRSRSFTRSHAERLAGRDTVVDLERAQQIKAEAARILAASRRTGHADWNGQDYAYVVPSPPRYPFQWFGTPASTPLPSPRQSEWAKQEIETLLKARRQRLHTAPDPVGEDRFPYAVPASRRSSATGTRAHRSSRRCSARRLSASTAPPAIVLSRTRPGAQIAFLSLVGGRARSRRRRIIAIIQPDESGVDASEVRPAVDLPKDNDDLVRWIERTYRPLSALRSTIALSSRSTCSVEEVLTTPASAGNAGAVASLRRRHGPRIRRTAERVTSARCRSGYDSGAGAFSTSGNDEAPTADASRSSRSPARHPTLDRHIVEHW